jgi:hypothetical protein
MSDDFAFELPDDVPPEMAAFAAIGEALTDLRASVQTLHEQQTALAQQVRTRSRHAPDTVPWPLQFRHMNQQDASTAWAWLIDWVDWFVARYSLAEELPACWPRHGALIEELAALAAGWYTAYDDTAPADAPIVWHERLARTRARLRDWDDSTRCRNGTHTPRRLELDWPSAWRDDALAVARADIAGRLAADTDERGGDTA